MNKSPRGYAYGTRATWDALRFGSFINWTNNIPNGTELYPDNRESAPFAVDSFTPSNVDVDDWINFSASIGLEYLVFTVKHNMGWSWFPFSTDLEAHTGKDDYNTTISLPQIDNYHVGNAATVGTTDQDIVHQFVAKCIAAGIKPVLYYNIGKDINARGGFSSINSSAFSSDADINTHYPKYTAMVEAHIQELLETFPDIWLWLDACAWYPRNAHQSLYNKIKTYGNENTLVIYNYDPPQGSSDASISMKPSGTNATYYEGSLPADQYYLWPFDVASFESTRVPSIGAPFAKLQVHKKHLFWTGREVCSPIFDSQWFYRDSTVVGGTPNVLSSEASLNAIADTANTGGAPYLCSLCPDEDGVISQAQKDRITLVSNHIFP